VDGHDQGIKKVLGAFSQDVGSRWAYSYAEHLIASYKCSDVLQIHIKYANSKKPFQENRFDFYEWKSY